MYKKTFSIFSLLMISGLALLASANFVFANQPELNRPDGLEKRGPLERVTFIHYRNQKNNAKPPHAGGGKKNTNNCYDFIAKGARWRTIEDFVVNPTNNASMSASFISQAVSDSVDSWENQTETELFGSFWLDNNATFSFDSTDGLNVLKFGPYSDPDVIGVTNVWGYFSGPPQTRELVEWDMLLNTAYNWGDAQITPELMDLQNILTHELGHSAGLGDLYESSCQIETMYGYSENGEISKRTLEAGDIAGIKSLY